MCSPVSLQLIAPREPLPTEHPGADEGPLPRVPAQMRSQVGCLPVHLPTARNVTDVLLLFPHVGSSKKTQTNALALTRLSSFQRGAHIRLYVQCRVPALQLPHLPPASLQLGQVQATLRSRLPSWPSCSSSSSTSRTRRWDRSLVFSVESLPSCQSSESGSSFIWISGRRGVHSHININISFDNGKLNSLHELLCQYFC